MLPAIFMTEKEREEFVDDGRTICSMDADGMPQSMFHVTREKIKKSKGQSYYPEEEPMTGSEYRRYTWYAIMAGLTVVGVIGGGSILFIFILWLLWK